MAALAIEAHNLTVLKELMPGDTVEIDRVLYSHWAVYVGDGNVIHLTISNANANFGSMFKICGKTVQKAVVKVDKFLDVACGSKAFINNGKDKYMSPSNGKEIVARAMKKIGEKGYNILWRNCEHFASFCRYEEYKSDQADKFLKLAAVTVAVVVAVAIIVALVVVVVRAFTRGGTSKKKPGNGQNA